MKVLSSYWFNPMGADPIGVIKVSTDHEGIRYFIGIGRGKDKEEDEQHIAQTGAAFPSHIGTALFAQFGR